MEQRTRSLLALCVSAEVRSRKAVDNLTQRDLADALGRSQNYVGERLRDAKPFSLDDLEALARFFGDEDPAAFVDACSRHLGVLGRRAATDPDIKTVSGVGLDGDDGGDPPPPDEADDAGDSRPAPRRAPQAPTRRRGTDGARRR